VGIEDTIARVLRIQDWPMWRPIWPVSSGRRIPVSFLRKLIAARHQPIPGPGWCCRRPATGGRTLRACQGPGGHKLGAPALAGQSAVRWQAPHRALVKTTSMSSAARSPSTPEEIQAIAEVDPSQGRAVAANYECMNAGTLFLTSVITTWLTQASQAKAGGLASGDARDRAKCSSTRRRGCMPMPRA
jgi:hypothetical protein